MVQLTEAARPDSEPPARGLELAGPSIGLLRRLHRSDLGYASFAAKIDGQWKELFAAPIAGIQTLPPEAVALLDRDAFCTINTMYGPGHGRNTLVPSLPRPARKRDRVSRLNACYTDLDVYKAGLSPEHVVAELVESERAGTIPPASVLVLSGRGVWALWMLDDGHGLPPSANWQTKKQYGQIQRAIQHKLQHLGSDPAAKDTVRCIRVPGSLHSGSGRRVEYQFRATADGSPLVYTLADLSKAFDVQSMTGVRDEQPRRPVANPAFDRYFGQRRTDTSPSTPGCRARSESGWVRVNRSRLHQFENLLDLRDGCLDEGTRNQGLFIYAVLLRLCRMREARVQEKVHHLGDTSGLKPCECEAVLRSTGQKDQHGRPQFRVTNRTISDVLGITPGEASQLKTLKAASKYPQTKEPNKRETRLRIMTEIIQDRGGRRPTCREMARLLKGHSLEVSHMTVARDYRAL